SAMNYVACQKFWRRLVLATLLLIPMYGALAGESATLDAALLAPLADGDTTAKLRVISQLGQLPDPAAAQVLKALAGERLLVTPQGDILLLTEDGRAWNPLAQEASAPPAVADTIIINNRLRGAINGALAATELFSDDPW